MSTLAHSRVALFLHPLRSAQQRFRHWLQTRLPAMDSVTLTQRNVYILPTGAGTMMGLTLLLLLIASINYQLNLGYALTFLLLGCVVVGMLVCHASLRGLSMHLVAPEADFAGTDVPLTIRLANQRNSVRYGIGLALWDSAQWSWADVPAQGSAEVQVRCPTPRRGLHPLPALTAETRFPLGTFRVWTVWRPAAQILVYPAPEKPVPALPSGEPSLGGAYVVQRQITGEFDGVRAYRRGDPMKHIVWKKIAHSGALVSRDAQQAQQTELWLDLAQVGPAADGTALTPEQRLARLCAWVLEADARAMRYGLRLGAQEIPPDSGSAHRRACLRALALYP